MANSKRKCPFCGTYNRMTDDGILFNYAINRLFCDIGCFSGYATKNYKKLADKTKKKKRTKTLEQKRQSVKYWIPKVQEECNKYIRNRDRHLPCISCGTTETVQWEAGHYKSVGAHPELRFDTRNIHKQCHRCNHEGSANFKGGKGWGWGYDKGMVERFGQERLDWLQGHHEQKNYTAAQLQVLLKWLKSRNKRFEN